jgi:hypothetical protein
MTPPTPPDHWLYVATPFVFYGLVVLGLALFGEHGEERNPIAIFFRRISWTLERLTGYPGWAVAGALSALLMLGVGVVGLYWDVAFHIDRGRDEVLFTPSHTMIVLGLGGLVYSAVIAVIFATLEQAPVGVRVLGLRLPWSALTLAALGAGAVAGFPLDDLWHEAYGVDVTLWSPTHLQLVGGGSLATLPVWLMLLEAGPRARPTLLGRGIHALALGAVLTGMSTFQGEFDFGVPQFQVAYLPILVAAAAAFTLVLARVALGPGGAVQAVVAFLVLRGCIALIVAGALHHTLPRFPLYLVAAACVEAAAWGLGTRRRLRFALVAGAAVGTIGVAGEMVWVRASGWFPDSPPALSKAVLLAPVAAVAAAVLGAALSAAVAGGTRLRWPAVALGLVLLAAALAYPLPREVGPVEAVVRLRPVGSSATVDVELFPPDAARRATAFGVVSWQGGGRVQAGLREVGPGRYVSFRPVPVTGSWKSMVGLQRDDEVMAAPVYLPADPAIGAPAVPASPERRVRFVRNTEVLLREAHDGPPWAAWAAYGGLAAVAALWLALLALSASRIGTPPTVVEVSPVAIRPPVPSSTAFHAG